MKKYSIENLRNIGIIGHSGTGKTSLAEALLYYAGETDRLGKVDDGNTVSDYDSEEKKRKISIGTSITPLKWDITKINLIDTPGYFDFIGEAIEGMRASDMGLIVCSGFGSVEVGTEKAWDYCKKIKLPRAFFINKLDRENSSFEKTLDALKDQFGISVVPIQYPIGIEENFKGIINVITQKARVYNPKTKRMEEAKVPSEYIEKLEECRAMLTESVAETDEELLEKFFEEGELSTDELYNGLIKGCIDGDIAPVMCGSALGMIGMETFLEDIVECFPSPKLAIPQKAINIEDAKITKKVAISNKEPFSAFVFKTIADPFVGKISILRVITGTLGAEKTVLNPNKDKEEKMTNMFFLKGKSQIPAKTVVAGDIVAVSKLQYTETGDTLCDKDFGYKYDKINFPEPVMSMSVIPKAKGDEEKISIGLAKLLEEDPSFKVERDIEHAETLIMGVGDTHIDVIASKLKNKFGVDIELEVPKIPYREAIKGMSDVQGKHKKQSGGHGQYGDVKIKFEPRDDGGEGLEFIDKVVGGVVPRNYIPAVEKGLLDCMKTGVLGGFPVIALKATLHDGSYHPVDSSEMAFKVAASVAYKKGIEQAKPILLEPVMHVEVIIPDNYMGDVMGDINKKRGRVLGMEQVDKGQKVIAEIPMAEMFKYATDLRSMTQARGSFTYSFERYEEVPEVEVKKILGDSKK
ncbi:MAG: elongation factor G [Sarcina sp.]